MRPCMMMKKRNKIKNMYKIHKMLFYKKKHMASFLKLGLNLLDHPISMQ